jgi:Fur family peroxide stress response transcriptional regulator
MERLTSQKKITLDYLKSVKTHPTAEKVYKEVKKKLPQISQATVYRILNNFKDKDLVRIIPVKGSAHFDADVSSHAHFICEKCNNVYDVFDVCSKCNILKNKKLKVGKINNYKIYFYGKCEKCLS